MSPTQQSGEIMGNVTLGVGVERYRCDLASDNREKKVITQSRVAQYKQVQIFLSPVLS